MHVNVCLCVCLCKICWAKNWITCDTDYKENIISHNSCLEMTLPFQVTFLSVSLSFAPPPQLTPFTSCVEYILEGYSKHHLIYFFFFLGQAFLRSNKPTGCWKSFAPLEAEDEVIMETVFAAISHGVSYRYMNCSVLLLGNLGCDYVNLAIKD